MSNLAEYHMACKVLLVTRICGWGNAPTDLDGIQMPNGTIYTGYYKNWNALSQEDKDKVLAEWKKRCIDKSRNSNKVLYFSYKIKFVRAVACARRPSHDPHTHEYGPFNHDYEDIVQMTLLARTLT